MTITTTRRRDLWFSQRLTTSNEAIAAKAVAVIAPMDSKKRRNDLQIMNNLANFAPSNGKRVR